MESDESDALDRLDEADRSDGYDKSEERVVGQSERRRETVL